MGNSKKKEKREADKERKRLEAEAQRLRDRRRRVIVIAIPILTAAAAATSWFYLEQPALTGAAVLAGAMAWLFVGLGFIGSDVTPRDRIRAGSIDFGRKRK